MPTELIRCEWCGQERYPNELQHSPILNLLVCRDCDCDNDRTLGEIEENRRAKARKTSWREGRGWCV